MINLTSRSHCPFFANNEHSKNDFEFCTPWKRFPRVDLHRNVEFGLQVDMDGAIDDLFECFEEQPEPTETHESEDISESVEIADEQ